MGIRCGFQSIAAIEALHNDHHSAIVLAGGGNQQSFSAKFNQQIL
jgi:hypothetical protein